MTSAPQIWVQTSFFQVEAGEDKETNPGRYGRAFANWLAEKFRQRGEPMQQVLSEDWGWCVMLHHQPYAVWVGCGNRDGKTDEWGAFVVVEPTLFQRLFHTVDTKPVAARIQNVLHEIMQEVPGATRIWVEGIL